MKVGDLVKFEGAPAALDPVPAGLAVITKVIQSIKNGYVADPNDLAYEIVLAGAPFKRVLAFECEVNELCARDIKE